jgi:chromosome condensin MukBEF MukE localization factor
MTISFTILKSNVSEDGGTRKDVETRIQKVRGAFTRLRKMWMAHYVNKDTKIRLLNVYVKSVLLYGCQTWLVTCEI